MGLLEGMELTVLAGVFLAAALVIALAGTRLTRVADKLADRTGMGEAIADAIFIGGATSIPGLLTTTLSAARTCRTLRSAMRSAGSPFRPFGS